MFALHRSNYVCFTVHLSPLVGVDLTSNPVAAQKVLQGTAPTPSLSIAPTTCVLPYFCRSSGGGSKVKPEIAPIEARSVADRGSLQLYVFYYTSVASSRGQCNTWLQLRVFYRTSVARTFKFSPESCPSDRLE